VEDALRLSEQRYRAVFDNTGTGAVLSEQDTTLSMANQGFADLVGYTRGDIEGRMKWTELIDPQAAPKPIECGLIDVAQGLREGGEVRLGIVR
jgi:PAS domain S-box-containing protein